MPEPDLPSSDNPFVPPSTSASSEPSAWAGTRFTFSGLLARVFLTGCAGSAIGGTIGLTVGAVVGFYTPIVGLVLGLAQGFGAGIAVGTVLVVCVTWASRRR